MTTILIFNVVLSAVVFATVVSLIAWAVATHRRDPALALAGRPRRVRQRRERRGFQGGPARA